MDRATFEIWLVNNFPTDPAFIHKCLRLVDDQQVADISPVMVLRELNRKESPVPLEVYQMAAETPFTSC